MSGFGIYANYTHTWAKADLGFGREGFLPGQAGDVANFSLFYDKGRFSARISAMFQDAFLMEVGKDENWDEWTDKHWQFDFSATYDVLSWMKVYFDIVNLSNAPKLEYYGVTNRPMLQEFYGWWIKGGIKITR
jgi:hypothetical protein